MHPRCVQIAEKARSSPDGVRRMMPASFPNLNTLAESGGMSSALNDSVTLAAADSVLAGGTTYRAIG